MKPENRTKQSLHSFHTIALGEVTILAQKMLIFLQN